MEGVDVKALVLPDKARLLQVILQEGPLGVIGCDDGIFLTLCLELLSYFKHCSSLSRVLQEKI